MGVPGWVQRRCLAYVPPAKLHRQDITITACMHAALVCVQAYADANSIAAQALGNIRTVYAFNGEQRTLDAYAAQLDGPVKVSRQARRCCCQYCRRWCCRRLTACCLLPCSYKSHAAPASFLCLPTDRHSPGLPGRPRGGHHQCRGVLRVRLGPLVRLHPRCGGRLHRSVAQAPHAAPAAQAHASGSAERGVAACTQRWRACCVPAAWAHPSQCYLFLTSLQVAKLLTCCSPL